MRWLLPLVLLAACGGGDGAVDAAALVADAAAQDGPVADATTADATAGDDAAAIDAASGQVDASVADAAPDAMTPDAAAPDAGFATAQHVHIYVSNTCVMSVSPTSFTVPAGETLQLTYHNHSNDYAVDVWKSYGGGYLDLMPGASWNETYEHCFGPSPTTEYADISTACSNFRLYVYCQ